MGDQKQKGQGSDFKNILGIKEICKSYKNLVLKWGPRGDKSKNNNNDDSNRPYPKEDDESPSTSRSFFNQSTCNHDKGQKKEQHESFFTRSTSSLLSRSRSGSRRSQTPTSMQRSASRRSKSATRRPTTLEIPQVSLSNVKSQGRSAATTPTSREFGRTTSKRSTTPGAEFGRSTSKRSTMLSGELGRSTSNQSTTPGAELGRSTSRRSTTPSAELGRTTSKRSTTPIVFSQSTVARRKPSPVEKHLECTLEELCFGAVKNITIQKDVINDGIIRQQEENLKINVKPGWRNGTKITFEGKGDEKPGYLPADIIFLVCEKRHPLFKWVGDDLELGVEVPLAKALTGCTITMPLLGGEKMTLRINDVIRPGFQKSIAGQGMPILNQDGRRGELVLKFMVEFPKRLSDEQRFDIRGILEESFMDDE